MFKIQSHVYAFRCNIICHLHHDKQYTMYNISQALWNIVQHYCHEMWASLLVEVLQIIVSTIRLYLIHNEQLALYIW